MGAPASYSSQMKRIAGISVIAAILLAGCASSRSVLYSGQSIGVGTKKTVVTDAAAVRDARSARAEWVAMVNLESGHGLKAGFAAVPPHKFRSQLAAAARRYGFTVKRVDFLHPQRPTPLVIVQTSRYVAFAHAVPSVEHSLDPHRGNDDLKGWSFGGFCLEALDERGVPFLVVSNTVSRNGVTGGQWARSDPLYPFAHG